MRESRARWHRARCARRREAPPPRPPRCPGASPRDRCGRVPQRSVARHQALPRQLVPARDRLTRGTVDVQAEPGLRRLFLDHEEPALRTAGRRDAPRLLHTQLEAEERDVRLEPAAEHGMPLLGVELVAVGPLLRPDGIHRSSWGTGAGARPGSAARDARPPAVGGGSVFAPRLALLGQTWIGRMSRSVSGSRLSPGGAT